MRLSLWLWSKNLNYHFTATFLLKLHVIHSISSYFFRTVEINSPPTKLLDHFRIVTWSCTHLSRTLYSSIRLSISACYPHTTATYYVTAELYSYTRKWILVMYMYLHAKCGCRIDEIISFTYSRIPHKFNTLYRPLARHMWLICVTTATPPYTGFYIVKRY